MNVLTLAVLCHAGKCAISCGNGLHRECWSYCRRPRGSKGNCCSRGLFVEEAVAAIASWSQSAEGVSCRSEVRDSYNTALVPQWNDTGSGSTADQPIWHCGWVST